MVLGILQLRNKAAGNVLAVQPHGPEYRAGGGQRPGHLFDNGVVDLLLHGSFCLAGDFWGDGILLFVFKILDLRVLQLTVQQADEIAGKVLRHHQSRIVVTGIYAVQRRLLILQEDPAHLIVGLKPLHHQLADVQVQTQDLAALVLAGHSHLNVAGGGGAVGVPVGEDVEPCVQERHQTQAQHDHHSHHTGS